MRNKKGFTLIELLAVIAVLAIILVIATTNVMGKIKDSKTKAKYTAAKEITDMAEAYIATNGSDDNGCILVEDMIPEYLEEDVTNPLNGENRSESNILTNQKVCKVDGNVAQKDYEPEDECGALAYNFDGYKYIVSVSDDASKICRPYEVGEEVCLGKECFYVTKDNGSSITALAKYNLMVGNEVTIEIIDENNNWKVSTLKPISNTVTNYEKQSLDAGGFDAYKSAWSGVLAFANSDKSKKINDCNEEYGCYYGYWSDSNGKLLSKYGANYPVDVYDSNSKLYTHVKNYESYLKRRGYKSISTRLITFNELVSLGCDYSSKSCTSAPSWIYDTSYWIATAGNYRGLYRVASNGQFAGQNFDMDYALGLRPVITISKSEIK